MQEREHAEVTHLLRLPLPVMVLKHSSELIMDGLVVPILKPPSIVGLFPVPLFLFAQL